ncbi:6-phosphogluconolactonase [Neokomagataea thailandica NBRC 106555]|uniref:6-phosphogluconolactonase n=2 Tax=Neokomagataea TaxID=1223423 RepID=A0A4Y6V5X2_9PROT|nr:MULTISPECIES: 6-phosphogluconolactonase [Neokomagataea]QDH25333.1 6-phosphogluconolactonase [Neokomagataea tanensis]GBR54872.1 6-phosphogluconolactonase [Neokomagataea thailandica NBRC 106555]
MTTDIRNASLETLADSEAVALRMAELLVEGIQAKADGLYRVALSGGSTPKRLFELLASDAFRNRVAWDRLQVFYGDERHVELGHPDGNQTVAQSVLLRHVPIPAENIFPIPTGATVTADAAVYEKALKAAYGSDELEKGRPLFDLVMLGLGTDGHTASLFPGQPVLHEVKAWVGTAAPETVPYERVTLTYPAIASSALVVFLVTGASKIEMLERLRAGDQELPSARVTSEGRIVILADRAAAGA